MSRSAPNGPGRRSRPVKRRQLRGLGKGRVASSSLPAADPPPMAEPLSAAERAHAIASMTRRLPLS